MCDKIKLPKHWAWEILHNTRSILVALKDLINTIGNWGTSWRDRALAAEASAAASNTALQNYLDTDADTDAAQISEATAAQRAEDERVAQEKWDELQALDVPAEEVPTTPADPAPPVEEGAAGTSSFNS